jgi:S-formylglutathione hydrolase FrmB
VLYLLHAMTMAYDHWAAPQRGEQLAAGFPGIIVMPEGGAIGFYSDWWDQGHRAGAKWESYYLRELVPMVERRYRVRAGRRWHAIAGVSMGGHGAIYLASQLPGYFGSASAFSAPLDSQDTEVGAVLALAPTMFGPGNDQDHLWGPVDGWYAAGHNPSRLVENLRQTRLFVSYATGSPCEGDRDGSDFDGVGPNGPAAFNPPVASLGYAPVLGEFERIARRTTATFVARAHAAGIQLREEAFPCGTHWWENFQRAFRVAREQEFFALVPESPASYSYTTTAQTGQAWDLHYAFAAAPREALTLIRRGHTLVARGSGRLTVTTAGGCSITAELPFEQTLPAASCQSLHLSGRGPLKPHRR